MSNEAGKGDSRRPEDSDKYRDNYDLIFRKPVEQDQIPKSKPESE